MQLTLSLALAALLAAPGQAPATTPTMVFCAPGYPGTTAEAQPSLDAFARAATAAAGWAPDALRAVYYETEQKGLERLAQPDAVLALLPWPFYVKHAAALRLVPIAHAASKAAGDEETWSLVAKQGRIRSAADLAGWEIFSLAGYAPEFVRDGALGVWGKLPGDVRLVAGGQVLSALRRASAGENVAVLLDGAQGAGVPSLPFAAQIETVATSPKVPVAVLCTVGTRLPAARARSLVKALVELHARPDGAAALEGLRLTRFAASKAQTPPSLH